MLDPVAAQNIAVAAMLAGAIVFFAAGYAVFYAFAMLRSGRNLMRFAYGSYTGLFAATLALTDIMQLNGWWLVLVASTLIGYFLAPRFVWHLSVAVHEAGSVD